MARLGRHKEMLRQLGWRDFSIRMLRAAGLRIFRRDPSRLFSFGMPKYAFELPKGYDLDLRRIRPAEVEAMAESQIAIPSPVLADRFSQGARMYGALWQDRIVYYAWSAGPPGFRETTLGFEISLKPDQVYLFDFKAVFQNRPQAFRSFRLLKALIHYTMAQEARRAGTDLQFFTLVSEQNQVSMAFHRRFLRVRNKARITLYRLLGRSWSRWEERC